MTPCSTSLLKRIIQSHGWYQRTGVLRRDYSCQQTKRRQQLFQTTRGHRRQLDIGIIGSCNGLLLLAVGFTALGETQCPDGTNHNDQRSDFKKLSDFRRLVQISSLTQGTVLSHCSVTACDGHDSKAQIHENRYGLSFMSPVSPIRIFRPNQDLEIAFDVRTRNPVYVLERLDYRSRISSRSNRDVIEDEHLGDDDTDDNGKDVVDDNNDEAHATGDSATGQGREAQQQKQRRNRRRRHHFYEEKSLPDYFRSRNQHYHLSGYDRGHLAPAADFDDDDDGSSDAIGSTKRADSYNLCNVSPQDRQFNRSMWSTLEHWTRQVAYTIARDAHQTTNHNDEDENCCCVYVVTGPLWLPQEQLTEKQFRYQYLALGRPPSLVAVPTHFFKVVVVVASPENQPSRDLTVQAFACFVMPNDMSSALSKAETKTLDQFLVRWTDLEIVSGLQFFPTLVNDEWKAVADQLTSIEMEKNQRRQDPQLEASSLSMHVLLAPPAAESNISRSSDRLLSVFQKKKHVKRKQQDLLRHLCRSDQCQFPKSRAAK